MHWQYVSATFCSGARVQSDLKIDPNETKFFLYYASKKGDRGRAVARFREYSLPSLFGFLSGILSLFRARE